MKIWWQGYASQYTQSAIDNYLAMIDGKVDVIFSAVRPDSNNAVWFDSALTPMRPERINGMLPGQYLIQEAHKRNIQVHAWFYVGWWFTYMSMHNPPSASWNMASLSGSDCNAINWINYSIPEMREFAANHIADIFNQNTFDGLNLDYLRMHTDNASCDTVTAEHITDLAQRARNKIGLEPYMSACFGRSRDSDNYMKRDVVEWLTRPALFDSVQCMSYDWSPERQIDILAYLETLPNQEKIDVGLGTVTRAFSDSPTRDGYELFSTNLAWWSDRGWNSFHIFDLPNLTLPMLSLLPEIEPDPEPAPQPDYGLLSQLHAQLANQHNQLSQSNSLISSIHNHLSQEYSRLSQE